MRHLIWCLLIGLFVPNSSIIAQNQGQLVVFVQPGRSISQDFIRNALPKIESMAAGENIPLKVVDATQGAPSEVTLTPSVFYKNGDEYLPYNGRYTDVNELGNFVRAGGNSSNSASPERADVMVWKSGRTTLAAHCKMHPIDGVAANFDEAQAMSTLTNGMAFLQKPDSGGLPDNARSFYLDFYPEKTADGLILIQMALYSEFDLENPVFKSEIPSGSEWKEWQTAFDKAGKRIEAMLLAQLGSNENGDGFEPLRKNVPVRSWNTLVTVEIPEPGMLSSRR